MIGTTFGPYQVVSKLGEGGMGEVYRARDTRLKRDVALKLLPASCASDPDRLARFQREAEVLASLNHPHIAHLYGVEQAPDQPGAPQALIMELVEGEDLSRRLARGAMTLDETLAIAHQVIEALDAAHTQGIVHRDLKPANIKLRTDGTVKVLDFGLAKSYEAMESDPAHSPTVTAMSRSGVILGTAAYMSPEQARGKMVDKRSDIWAFGCVLYEMLSGVSPFAAPTTTDTLAAIVTREPDWRALPPATPQSVRSVLELALQKDPKQRLRDIADARVLLQRGADARDAAPTATHRTAAAWQIVAVLSTVAAVMLGVRQWRDAAPQPPDRDPVLARVTSNTGLTTEPSFSGDGRIIAYASNRAAIGNLDIWMQQTAGGGAVQLTTDPNDDRSPDISPDGTQIAFRSERGEGGVYVIPALGGDARLIAPEGRAPKFSPDGRSIAYWTGGWLAVRGVQSLRRTYIVDVTGGAAVQMATELATAGDPIWSPDGAALLVHARRHTSGPDTAPNWWIVPVRGGPPRMTNAYEVFRAAGIDIDDVDSQPYPQQWTPDGVLFSATTDQEVRAVWSVGLDAATGQVRGSPRKLTLGTTWDEEPAAAADGSLAFAGLARDRLILGLPLDANGGRAVAPVRVLRRDVSDTVRSTVSLDGNVLAFPRFAANAGSVWLRDVRTGRERQLAATRRTPLNPIISADGQWVAYTVSNADTGGNSGPGTGFILSADGGAPRQVCDDCEIYQWLRTNKAVVARRPATDSINVIDVDTRSDTVILASETGKPAPRPDLVRPVGGQQFSRPLVSYDERFVSFLSEGQAYVAPFTVSARIAREQWQPILAMTRSGERTCGWSPDSRLLYFLLERDGFRCLYAIRIDPATGRASGELFPVAHFHDASREWGSTGFSSAVANGIFVFNQVELAGNVWMLK